MCANWTFISCTLWLFLFCISHCGNVLMREKQLWETRWGVKIYFPHFLCVKTVFLICSNPAVAFTRRGTMWPLKQHWGTDIQATLKCLPRWKVWERERAKENLHYRSTHTDRHRLYGQSSQTYIHDFIQSGWRSASQCGLTEMCLLFFSAHECL